MKLLTPTPRGIIVSAEQARALANGATQIRVPVKPQPGTFDHIEYDEKMGWHRWWDVCIDASNSSHVTQQYEKVHCPFGSPGQRVYFKEAWRVDAGWDDTKPAHIFADVKIFYEADGAPATAGKLRSAICMPEKASRLHFEVVAVRVERVQEISAQDSVDEGLELVEGDGTGPKAGYVWTGRGYWDGFSRSITTGEKTYHVPHWSDGLCHCNSGLGLMPSRCAFAHRWDRQHPRYPWSSNPWCFAATLRRGDQKI